MKNAKKIQRMDGTDPYKWFSESHAHTEKFVNHSSSDTGAHLLVWLNADAYLGIRSRIAHETFSAGSSQNRFHQENASVYRHLINIGIHSSEEETFNKAIREVADLKGAKFEVRDDLLPIETEASNVGTQAWRSYIARDQR